MPTTLELLILGALVAAGLFTASQWQRYRIRHTGTLVTAKVTQVAMWQDTPGADYSPQLQMLPFPGMRTSYEIRAEWTDPRSGNTYVFTSGIKRGWPRCKRGDYLAAYMSPYGTYLKLS